MAAVPTDLETVPDLLATTRTIPRWWIGRGFHLQAGENVPGCLGIDIGDLQLDAAQGRSELELPAGHLFLKPGANSRLFQSGSMAASVVVENVATVTSDPVIPSPSLGYRFQGLFPCLVQRPELANLDALEHLGHVVTGTAEDTRPAALP